MWRRERGHTSVVVACLVLFLIGILSINFRVEAAAEDEPVTTTQVLDVLIGRTLPVVALTRVTHALVVDEDICRAEVDSGALRLTGIKRGETVVVVWTDAPTATTYVVH